MILEKTRFRHGKRRGRGWLARAMICLLLAGVLRAEQPFQNWLMLGISQRLDYGLEASLGVENEFSSSNPTWSKIEVTPEVIWHYSPRYDFSVGYMYSYENDAEGMHDAWSAGLFSGTVKLPLQRWYITSRQRFEFGERQNRTIGMYRQLTRIEYAQSWLPWKLKPFLADEWFYDMQDGYLSENRLYGGFSYEINKSYMTEIYLMRQDMWTLRGDSMEGLILGVGINMKF